jgi:hypothetical protein
MEKIEHNDLFEMIYFMKKRDDLLSNEEFIVYEYMFQLRIAKMNEDEKVKLETMKNNLTVLLERVYEKL